MSSKILGFTLFLLFNMQVFLNWGLFLYNMFHLCKRQNQLSPTFRGTRRKFLSLLTDMHPRSMREETATSRNYAFKVVFLYSMMSGHLCAMLCPFRQTADGAPPQRRQRETGRSWGLVSKTMDSRRKSKKKGGKNRQHGHIARVFLVFSRLFS